MTIAACRTEWDRIARLPGVFYCNEVWLRCSNPMCRDCSTFAASGINAGFPNSLPACSNSFGQARWCRDTPRPQWMTDKYGPGIGTFITYEQAQTVECPILGFRGNNLGTEPDNEGDGHVEVICGSKWNLGPYSPNPKLSVGAHSHATGVGYDLDGLDTHNLSFFAIPPCFLAELAPIAWKVPPQMQEHLNARLRKPGPTPGWWIGLADGRVDLLKDGGGVVHGGMVTPEDKEHFAGRTLARLVLRKYRPKGKVRSVYGYTIVATSGETYEPTPQH